MFTRFSASRRHGTAPIAGTFLSLTVHAAVVAAAVGGDALGAPWGTVHPEHAAGASAAAEGERLHWVGTGRLSAADLPAPRPGTPPPVAFVVPGRGPLRESAPPLGWRGRRARGDAAAVKSESRTGARAAVLRAPVARRAGVHIPLLPLIPLPQIPDVDVAVLVAGVISSAPDPAREVVRSDDFARFHTGEPLADRLARANVTMSQLMQTTTHVDELPIALVTNPMPVYPAALERGHVGGRVVVEFTIDSAGAIVPASLRVLQSTNALFTQAVREVLPRLRFLPAQLGEHAVGVTVRQPFEFRMRAGV